MSLGRSVIEPLHEVTSLFLSHDQEIHALKMHPQQVVNILYYCHHSVAAVLPQDLVSRDQLKTALERELVAKVNELGVNIDHCLEHKHCEGLVTFVCGLGPRKASALLKVLFQTSRPCYKLYHVCATDTATGELSVTEPFIVSDSVSHWSSGVPELCWVYQDQH